MPARAVIAVVETMSVVPGWSMPMVGAPARVSLGRAAITTPPEPNVVPTCPSPVGRVP